MKLIEPDLAPYRAKTANIINDFPDLKGYYDKIKALAVAKRPNFSDTMACPLRERFPAATIRLKASPTKEKYWRIA